MVVIWQRWDGESVCVLWTVTYLQIERKKEKINLLSLFYALTLVK